jgi:hypothetical protein
MGRSRSKKKLVHSVRNGLVNIDPDLKRGDFGDLNGVKKMTPTLSERINRKENKHKGRDRYNDDHAYFVSVI